LGGISGDNGDRYSVGSLPLSSSWNPGDPIVPLCSISPCSVGLGTPLSASAGITFIRGPGNEITFTLSKPLDGLPTGTYAVDLTSGLTIQAGLKVLEIIPYLTHFDELAARITAIDTATVAGGISRFVQTFNYQSGINLH
jgi:hypothetical protein